MELTPVTHAVITVLRIMCDRDNLKYTRDTIVRTVHMGANGSFRFN